MAKNSSQNKYYLLPIAALSSILVVLFGISFFILAPKIQNNLAKQVQKELSDHSISAEIALSGRDVTLRGTINNIELRDKAEVITKKICGIRFVDNQLLADKPENLALLNKKNEDPIKSFSETKEKSKEIPLVVKSVTVNPITKKVVSSIQKNSPIIIQANNRNTKLIKEEPDQEKTNQELDSKVITKEKKIAPLIIASNKKTPNKEDNKSQKSVERQSNKQKNLNYESMLAAMNAYNKEKKNNKVDLKTKDKREKKVDETLINIKFNSGSKNIRAESNPALNQLLNELQADNSLIIKITVSASNSSLGFNRAKSIKKYLMSKSIQSKKINISGRSGKEAVNVFYNP